MLKSLIICTLLIISWVGTTQKLYAEESEHYCSFDQAQLAKVKPSIKKLYFIRGYAPGCPSNSSKCRDKAYIVKNQPLIVGEVYKDWVCSLYIPKNGQETIGWLPKNSLIIQKPTTPTYQQWLGWWRTPEQFYSIEIQKGNNGLLNIMGNGLYQHFIELSDGSKERCTHPRHFETTIKPSGSIITDIFNEEKKEYIEMQLIGDYLLVTDQANLGGNVSFSGIYQKYHRPKQKH